MSGWIRIDRKIFGHEFFAREQMSEREAWIWMLSRAAWEDTTHRVGGDLHDVPRGSFMATLRELQSVFMWRSDTKVRGFLKRLEAERMIERTTCGPKNAPKTRVTICNYDDFQQPQRTENAPKTHRERTEKRSKETNINNKQDKVQDRVFEILCERLREDTARDFIAHRRGIKKPVTELAAQKLVSKVHGHSDPDAVFNESIAQGWQGIFPDKVVGKKTSNLLRNGMTHDEWLDEALI